MFGSCSGRGMPRPYKNERSVTWRSGLLIDLTFTHKNMPTPGPGPQARCGKGEGSGEGLGDRCRVPRSSPPSGAGGEQVKLLQSTQRDDLPTKGEHAAAAATPHPALRATFPSKGKAKGAKTCFFRPRASLKPQFLTNSKKLSKKSKKGVDKPFKGCYYVQARSRATNLENDTE